ncbi:MAG: proline--tRNA ligase [Acidimicrobiia bacterium]
MRWSQAFIPTLRDDPAEAEAASHRLLVRAGYIRQLAAGHYTLLGPAVRVRRKLIRIIREEMDAIGGQEFLLPAMHPAEVWQASGRWSSVGDELFRFTDRRGADTALAMTHEEVFASVARELSSYRQLPQVWYQFQTKFRDEPRPKAGLLRVREFTMKDSYSFDLDEAGLDVAFEAHRRAYRRIFGRLGFDLLEVDASVGMMGGSGSVEFMVRSESGEDLVAVCASCGYAANLETARSTIPATDDPAGDATVERFPTPGVRTIADLVAFEGGAPADRQVKTLVYLVGNEPVMVLLRGDHDLQEQKLADALGAADLRPAHDEEIVELLGAHPGSLGAVGVTHVRVVADRELRGRRHMTTGANLDDHHVRGVDVERDIEVSSWLDLREVRAGEPCPECGEPLSIDRTIEIGHIFKLGRTYTEAFDVAVLGPDGGEIVPIMGSYGIGVERNLAAAVEVHHDEAGIVWPMNLAPWEVVVTIVRPDDEATAAAAAEVVDGLAAAGIEVISDDRDERPGVKFADAELVGIPVRVTVGPRGVAGGQAEVTVRATGERTDVPLADVVEEVAARVRAAR